MIYSGTLYNTTFITGSMFTGKTSWLIETKTKYYNNKNSILYRPNIDTRKLETHKGIKYSAKPIKDLSSLGEAFSDKIKAVFIDEVQFLPDVLGYDIAIEQLNLIQNIKPLFVAGLDYRFNKTPFPISEWLEKHVNNFTRLKTYCIECGKLSECYSRRKSPSDELIVIGGKDDYEPVCYKCMK